MRLCSQVGNFAIGAEARDRPGQSQSFAAFAWLICTLGLFQRNFWNLTRVFSGPSFAEVGVGNEIALRRSAEALIETHGADAAEICSKKALLWHRRGDQEAAKIWLRLAEEVQRIERERKMRLAG
jgi:hypothetical protein